MAIGIKIKDINIKPNKLSTMNINHLINKLFIFLLIGIALGCSKDPDSPSENPKPIVVISNLDQNGNNQVRFVGSMTHANTKNTRIKYVHKINRNNYKCYTH
jgi:hypothetical protein